MDTAQTRDQGRLVASGRRLAASLVHEVSVTDPAIYIGTALTITVISVGATWLPARRTGRVDPIAALRTD